ncbi:hypothetical protein RXA29_22315 [Dickeya solani]|uniref:Mannitol dehydrogenase C-terminal domain-containing protein n=1 Tax=Dickeya solani TaxID=1089444 RepID=A0AAX4EZB4_9GAMM|nr:hypothetical protein [Dickeya solani]WOA52556.1 hypothetical protein RXA29_22315 [Dickeya solani]
MTASLLTANAQRPDYDRNTLTPRIVHLGFGAFHRAHQAVYADRLAAEHASDWGYCDINLIGGEQQIADLKRQDLLFSVAEMSPQAWYCRVVGVAGWMRYVGGVDEQGQPIEISDPLKEALALAVQHSEQGEARVRALLAQETIFGRDLPADGRFVQTVTRYYLSLVNHGVKATLQALTQ